MCSPGRSSLICWGREWRRWWARERLVWRVVRKREGEKEVVVVGFGACDGDGIGMEAVCRAGAVEVLTVYPWLPCSGTTSFCSGRPALWSSLLLSG